jgi:hypothetical protein
MLAAVAAERQQALVGEIRRKWRFAVARSRSFQSHNAQRIALGKLGFLNCNCDRAGLITAKNPQNILPPNIELRAVGRAYRLFGLDSREPSKPTPVFLCSCTSGGRLLESVAIRGQAMFERKPYCINYRIVLAVMGKYALWRNNSRH